MKIKVNDEEKNMITDYLSNLIDLPTYGYELFESYPTMLELNDNGLSLEIINKYYIDEDKYDSFKESKEDYIKDNYKELLFINDNLNCNYQIQLNPKDTSFDNAVKNGTLVLKVNKIIDYNGYLKSRLQDLDKFEKELKRIEKDISSKIGVPVRILSRDVRLPIKNKK